jgi:hypothetical protein
MLGLHPAAGADDDALWQLRHTDASTGTRVYLRGRGDLVPEFRAIAVMPTRLSALVAVLLDTDAMPQWVYRTRRVVRVEASAPTQGVSQVITAMPWPLSDREAIVEWRLTQDADTGVVLLEGRGAPDRLPPSQGLVRMPSFESRWRFAPLAEGRVEVLFEGHGDLGGNLALPALRAFVDAALWEAPLQTVNALRQMVERDEYRHASLAFVREPQR